MRVLYIGGTGEISTACVQASLEAGHEVSVFNRANNQDRQSLVTQFTGDLTQDQAYQTLEQYSFDVVCQFLAFEPEQIERDLTFFANRCEQYIFISSASVYQKPPANSVTSELTPLSNSFWPYAAKKIACENKLKNLSETANCEITIVRPSHTYRTRLPGAVMHGDHQTWRLLNNLPIVVHGDGNSLWTLTHAQDFADAFIALFANEKAYGESIHITHEQAHTWNQIIKKTGELLGVSPKIVHCDIEKLTEVNPDWYGPLLGDKANSMVFDNSKLHSITGQSASKIGLEQGLELTWSIAKLKQTSYQPNPGLEKMINELCSGLS